MTARKKPKKLLLRAAAIGGGSLLAAATSGCGVTVLPTDAGLSDLGQPDLGGDASHGITVDGGGGIDAAGPTVDAGGDAGHPVGTTIMDAGTTVQDAGDDGHIVVGVIVHPDGG